jgi:hypothetical protein
MMSRPVTPCWSLTTLESLIAADSQQLFRAVFLPGPLAGQVPPVAGVQPDHLELGRGHEAGRDRAALKARRQPPRVGRVPLGTAGQVPDLPGIGQHAVEPPVASSR